MFLDVVVNIFLLLIVTELKDHSDSGLALVCRNDLVQELTMETVLEQMLAT